MNRGSDKAKRRVDITTLLSYQILILSSTLARWAAREYGKRFGLKLAEWRILSIVGARGSMSVNAVSDAISIDKAWISRSVPGLQERGLLCVTGDPKDRRRTLLEITPKGASIHRKMSQMSLARQQRLVKALTRSEMNEFRRLLAVLQAEAETMLEEQDDLQATDPENVRLAANYTRRQAKRRAEFKKP